MKLWNRRRMNVKKQSSSTATRRSWKDLYVAALLEGDKDRVRPMIAEAERAISERSKQLFDVKGDNLQEREALGEALYALHALKSCLAIHGKLADAV